MNVQEIQNALSGALKLRVPAIDPNAHPRERIDAMENYLVDTARTRGDLEEAVYWCIEARKPPRREWETIQGWEVHLPRGAGHTKEQVAEAKRRIKPQLFELLRDLEELLSSLYRQIRRLELDYDAISREYTFISGK